MLTLFGIKNCDTVKKARKWLEQNDIAYQFHDFRSDGLQRIQVKEWIDTLGGETLLNRRSSTWRQLDKKPTEPLDESVVLELLVRHPTLIKRPVINDNGQVHVGFSERDFRNWFAT